MQFPSQAVQGNTAGGGGARPSAPAGFMAVDHRSRNENCGTTLLGRLIDDVHSAQLHRCRTAGIDVGCFDKFVGYLLFGLAEQHTRQSLALGLRLSELIALLDNAGGTPMSLISTESTATPHSAVLRPISSRKS